MPSHQKNTREDDIKLQESVLVSFNTTELAIPQWMSYLERQLLNSTKMRWQLIPNATISDFLISKNILNEEHFSSKSAEQQLHKNSIYNLDLKQ